MIRIRQGRRVIETGFEARIPHHIASEAKFEIKSERNSRTSGEFKLSNHEFNAGALDFDTNRNRLPQFKGAFAIQIAAPTHYSERNANFDAEFAFIRIMRRQTRQKSRIRDQDSNFEAKFRNLGPNPRFLGEFGRRTVGGNGAEAEL